MRENNKLSCYGSGEVSWICIDDYRSNAFLGRLYPRLDICPIPFKEVNQLINEIETYFNSSDLPKASTQTRVFKCKQNKETFKEYNTVENKDIKGEQPKGEKGTFLVQVQYRQNATWQGKIHWAEKNVTKQFRSALELIKLIDSALNEEDKE